MGKIVLTCEQSADLRVALAQAIEGAEESAKNAEGIPELKNSVTHWQNRARNYRDVDRILQNGYRIEVSPIQHAATD